MSASSECNIVTRVEFARVNKTVEVNMSVRDVVQERFASAAKSRNAKLPTLTDEHRLTDLGLDSLSFAVIVVELEEQLGFDPFNTEVQVSFPVTFGDFVRLYENHKAA